MKFRLIELSMFDKKELNIRYFDTAQYLADFLEVSRSTVFRMKKNKIPKHSIYYNRIKIESYKAKKLE